MSADLQTHAGELANKLSSTKQFKPVAEELLNILRCVRPDIFTMQIRKIITLVEIARTTLSRAGIRLHPFVSCAPALRPLKEVYFDLLRALREHRGEISETQIQVRADTLLLSLSSCVFIRKAGGPALAQAAGPSVLPPSTVPTPLPLTGANRDSIMPPPPLPSSSDSSKPSSPPQATSSTLTTQLMHEELRVDPHLRSARRKSAPMRFDEMEEELAASGENSLAMGAGRGLGSQLPLVRRKFGIFMSKGGARQRERGTGHARRRSVRGL